MGLTGHVVDLKKWRLDITVNIKEPRSLSYSQVVALPSIERAVLMICPENTGVRSSFFTHSIFFQPF